MKEKTGKLSDFKPTQRNSNKHSAKGMKSLDNSMAEDGYVSPMTVAADGEVIDGDARLETAFNRFGDDVVIVEHDGSKPVVMVRTDIPNAETPMARRIHYRANLTAWQNLSLDTDIVIEDIEAGFDFDAIDVSSLDLAQLMPGFDFGGGDDGKDTPPQIDRAEELRIKWGVELGQMWQLGEHRLICGDCTDKAVVDRVMGGEVAYIEIQDPPYGMRLDTDWSAAKSRLDFAAEKGVFGGKEHKPVEGDFIDFDPNFLFDRQLPNEMFLWGADYYAERIQNKNDGSWLIWDKRLNDSADKMYGSAFETLWSLKRHKRDFIRVKWAGIFGTEKEPDHKRHHPTQKPVLVYEWLLSRYSNEGDISGDFYLGVGSHLIACENLNRRCRAIEIDPGYVAVTLQRWADHTGQTPELLTDTKAKG